MNKIIRFFLKRFLNNRESFFKARLLLQIALVEVVISSVYFLIYPYIDFQTPRWLFLVIALASLASIQLFRVPLRFQVLAHFNIFLLWSGFCIGISFSGGIESPVVSWLAVLAVMANLMLGQGASYVWLIVSLTTAGFFHFSEGMDYSYRTLGSTSGLILIVFFFTFFYQSIHNELLKKINSKNHKLLARKKRLIQQHTEILKSKAFIEEVNKKLRVRIGEITEQSEAMERHWQTLLDISKSYIINFGRLDEAVEYITKTTAKSLGIDRVSIWRYYKDPERISCLYLYDTRIGQSGKEPDLVLTDFPNYFEALRKESVIPVIHAPTDETTSELKDNYLLPKKIAAMMDTPFFLDGELGGVLCCEHGTKRDWNYEDILFAIALAEIITLSFKAQERRLLEDELMRKQDEILRLNKMLEGRVKEQSVDIEAKNKQLEEYTYLNSHMLRAPLSRLLGWVGLLNDVKVPAEEKESILKHLKEAGTELDSVVSKINEALSEGTRNAP